MTTHAAYLPTYNTGYKPDILMTAMQKIAKLAREAGKLTLDSVVQSSFVRTCMQALNATVSPVALAVTHAGHSR